MRYRKPAEEIEHQGKPMPIWLHAFYLVLIFAAFAAAGAVDLSEAERLSAESFINAHHEFTSRADVGDPYDFGLARLPEPAVAICGSVIDFN